MMRMLRVLGVSAALLAGGCTDPYGQVDYGRTALLGAGVGAAALLVAGAAADRPSYGRGYRGGYRGGYGGSGYGGYGGGSYGPPPGYGYGRPGYSRGW